MASTTSKFITLYSNTVLDPPTLATDGGDLTSLWLPLFGGGPDRLVILVTAAAPTIIAGMRVWIYQDSLWRRLAVAGANDIAFVSLTIDAPVQFELQKIGRAERIAFEGTLDFANSVTFQAARGSDS